jgi:hypothetical protein
MRGFIGIKMIKAKRPNLIGFGAMRIEIRRVHKELVF